MSGSTCDLLTGDGVMRFGGIMAKSAAEAYRTTREMLEALDRPQVVRCADCAHCKQVRDGSGVWCELWRHRTRADGYCHMGEEGE